MKNKLKIFASLFLTLLLASCSKGYILVGNNKVSVEVKKTYMQVLLLDEGYDDNNVNLKLSLGIDYLDSNNDLTYCIYYSNNYEYYQDENEIKIVEDYTNIKNHYYITSYSDDYAVEQFEYKIKNKRIIYENSIDVKIDKKIFSVNASGTLYLKTIGFIKTTDNTYKISDKDINQCIQMRYKVVGSKVYLSDYEMSILVDA